MRKIRPQFGTEEQAREFYALFVATGGARGYTEQMVIDHFKTRPHADVEHDLQKLITKHEAMKPTQRQITYGWALERATGSPRADWNTLTRDEASHRIFLLEQREREQHIDRKNRDEGVPWY